MDYGGGPIMGPALAKFSPGGVHLWSRSTGSGGLNALAVHPSGVVAVAGFPFLRVFSASGALLWEKIYTSTSSDPSNGIVPLTVAFDPAGYVVLGGFYAGPASFGGPTYTSPTGIPAPFLVSYTAGGSFRWSRGFEGAIGSTTSVAVTPSGTVAAAGAFRGSFAWGAASVTASVPSGYRGFLVTANNSGGPRAGRVLWVDVSQLGLAADTDSVVVTGDGSGDLGGGAPPAHPGSASFFAARYGINVDYRWSRFFYADPSASVTYPTVHSWWVTVTASHQPLLCGGFNGTLTLGATSTASWNEDPFLLDLTP